MGGKEGINSSEMTVEQAIDLNDTLGLPVIVDNSGRGDGTAKIHGPGMKLRLRRQARKKENELPKNKSGAEG